MFNIKSKKCKFWVGNKKVKKMYLGAKKVFSAGNWVTYNVDVNNTYLEEWDEGSSVLTPTTFTPTKSGWTFYGWRETLEAVSNVLSSKIMGEDPITLYGVFQKIVTLTVYNNSTTATTKMLPRYYNNGNITNPTFTVSPATKSGWAFLGWTESTDANGDISHTGITNLQLTEDLTLYGKYAKNVTLSYNGNGATEGSTSSETSVMTYNSSGDTNTPTFIIKDNGFIKPKYTFMNWALNSADGDTYSPNALLNISSNAILYAIWKHFHTDDCYRTYQKEDIRHSSSTYGNCSGCGASYENHYYTCNKCGSDAGWARTSNCTCGQTPSVSNSVNHTHTVTEKICGID